MLNVTGLPHTLDEYIDFSMIAQAEGLKFGIEHFRRRKPHCAGTLFWQLNDCWPVLSWAVIDYYGVGKAGYFYAKRVYSPVLASFKEAEGVELWITNDTLEMISETITVRLAEFGGRVIWERNLEIDVPPNSSERLAYWDDAQLEPGPDRYLSVCSSSGTFPTNRHFFVPVKDLQRESVLPEMAITTVDAHTLRVDLRAAAGYAYFVHLVVPHEATLFSDNYFDLEAGERRTITITNPAIDLTPDLVTLRAR
jgi:beta-mannosidase